MKVIFILALLALSGWAGWSAYPRFKDSLDKGVRAELKRQADDKLAEEEADRIAKLKAENQQPPGGKPRPFTGVTPPPGPTVAGNMPPLPPAPGDPPKPADTPAAPVAAVDPIDAKYPMPEFKTIEEITKDWSTIPSRAFPKPVKTKVAIVFDKPAGKVTLPANSDAIAVGMVQGNLIVMPPEKDSRQTVPLANTNLKENLTELYEKYKDYQRKKVQKQRDRARGLAAAPAQAATDDTAKAAGPRPEKAADGTIPLLLADIRTGKLVELKEDAITNWGDVNYEEVEGEFYWTGTLQCTVENAIFGPTPTEVMALVKNGKVVKWLYTGSREPVQ